jgi:hypothetical protein
MRLPCCNGDTSTTVLAHSNGAGMGMKSDDFEAADMCSSCHDAYDGRTNIETHENTIEFCFVGARLETMENRIRRGILK